MFQLPLSPSGYPSSSRLANCQRRDVPSVRAPICHAQLRVVRGARRGRGAAGALPPAAVVAQAGAVGPGAHLPP
eukprot:6376303-Pyramimonas_sp.AAC.1